MEFFAIILFFLAIAIVTRWNNHKKAKKRKEEDNFIHSIDYSYRRPEVKSKPKNGRRRSKEEMLADGIAYQKLMGDDFRKSARATQIRAERVGSKNIFGVVLIAAQIAISRMGKHSLGQDLQKQVTQRRKIMS